MQASKWVLGSIFIAIVGSLSLVSFGAYAADSDLQPMARNLAEQKFGPVPGYPSCLRAAGLNGDPSKGPSILLLHFKKGCTVPWHWHTPDEHLMVASGAGRAQMKDGKAVLLKSGGYAFIPGHHIHMFTCVSACVIFLYSDGIFDTHYVDSSGREITPAEALKSK
ncbi:MAG: cupin domain-containing protein [Ktedonobacteraceae bacterium]